MRASCQMFRTKQKYLAQNRHLRYSRRMRLGNVIRKWRIVEEESLRDIAKQMGMPHATLDRVEKGEACNSDTLAKILLWLIGKAK